MRRFGRALAHCVPIVPRNVQACLSIEIIWQLHLLPIPTLPLRDGLRESELEPGLFVKFLSHFVLHENRGVQTSAKLTLKFLNLVHRYLYIFHVL